MISITKKSVLDIRDFSEVALTDGLVAWYPLDGNANDVSQYANDGVFTGTPSDLRAPSGVGLQFDGTSQYIQAPHASHLTVNPAGASYSFYVKRLGPWSSTTNGSHPLLKKDDWEYGTWAVDGNVRPHFNIAGTIYYADIPYTLPLNEWTHLTAVWDGTKVLQYVNGVDIPGTQSTSSSRTLTSLPLYIMANGGNFSQLAAGMADFRIFRKALSPVEAMLLYELTQHDHGSKIRRTIDRTYIKGRYRELSM